MHLQSEATQFRCLPTNDVLLCYPSIQSWSNRPNILISSIINQYNRYKMENHTWNTQWNEWLRTAGTCVNETKAGQLGTRSGGVVLQCKNSTWIQLYFFSWLNKSDFSLTFITYCFYILLIFEINFDTVII